ncbi:MAG: DNA cytosine methyltransferase [Alphaproteobacteria bacterium]
MIRDHYSAPLSALDIRMVQAVPQGGNWRSIPIDIPSKRLEQIRVAAAAGEGSRSTYYGRLTWDRPAYTISTYFNRPGNGCFIHPSADRLISIREAARLQSFPDSFRFMGSGRKRCMLVGNAVPPLLAYQLARALPKGPFIDLFCGAGGMSLGFEWAGHEPVMSVDHDRDAVATLTANTLIGRVFQADLANEEKTKELIAIARKALSGRQLVGLVGGPPCQGFSTAGSSLINDPRNRLVSVMLRWAEMLRPKFVLMENVPAMMWRRHRSVLPQIRSELALIGYETVCAIVHAEGYGVPQLRRRLIILAFEKAPGAIWASATHEIQEPAFLRFQPGWPSRTHLAHTLSVKDAISDLPEATAGGLEDSLQYGGSPETEYQQWSRGMLPLSQWLPNPKRAEVSVDMNPQLRLIQ